MNWNHSWHTMNPFVFGVVGLKELLNTQSSWRLYEGMIWYVMTPLALMSTNEIGNMNHYTDVIMSTMASQITRLTIVYSTVYSDADQRKHQSSGSLAFVRWIHRWPVNFPHKGSVTRKMLPFDYVTINQFYDHKGTNWNPRTIFPNRNVCIYMHVWSFLEMYSVAVVYIEFQW